MLRPRKEAPTYPVIIPIKTNRGYGETRLIGPTRVTFATAMFRELMSGLERTAADLRAATGGTPPA